MPAVNFKTQFAERVLRGAKRTTVRPGARFKVGDRFYGYYGMRTKQVRLTERQHPPGYGHRTAHHLDDIGRDHLSFHEFEHALAVGDGFSCLVEFCAFFAKQYGLPFAGQLVQWEPELGTEQERKKRLKQLARALAGKRPGGKRQ